MSFVYEVLILITLTTRVSTVQIRISIFSSKFVENFHLALSNYAVVQLRRFSLTIVSSLDCISGLVLLHFFQFFSCRFFLRRHNQLISAFFM